MGVPKPGCFKSGLLQFYMEALFCALSRPFALFCGLAFALFFAYLRSLRVSASYPIQNDRIWALLTGNHKFRTLKRDVSSPGFAPNPFCFSFLVLGFLLGVFFGRSGLSPSRRCSLGSSLCCFLCCSMRHACVTSYGGRWTRHPPPPLGLSSQLLFKIPRVLGPGTVSRCTAPLHNAAAEPSWSLPTSSSRATKRGPE